MNKKIVKFIKIVEKPIVTTIQIPFIACTHLFGETHTSRHRMFTGVIFMISGVEVSNLFIEVHFIHFIFDLVGYAIHGLGCLPFAERLGVVVNNAKKLSETKNDSIPLIEITTNTFKKIAAATIPTITLFAATMAKH